MPKLRKRTEQLRAIKLAKDYMAAGMNQTKLAKKYGTSSQNINQKLKKAVVQETMASILDRVGVTDDFLGKKILEGCEATKVTKRGKLPDHQNRHKYVTTALEVKKHIKADEATKPIIIQLDYGHRTQKADEPS